MGGQEGEGVEALTKLLKKGGGLGRISFSRGGVAGKEGVTFFRGRKGLQFSHKRKLKSEIFDDKKVYKQKMFISVITKNLNWEILTKNLVNFKRWNGVKDEKFEYFGGSLKNSIFRRRGEVNKKLIYRGELP